MLLLFEKVWVLAEKLSQFLVGILEISEGIGLLETCDQIEEIVGWRSFLIFREGIELLESMLPELDLLGEDEILFSCGVNIHKWVKVRIFFGFLFRSFVCVFLCERV